MSRFVFSIYTKMACLAVLVWLGFGQAVANAQGLADHIAGFPMMPGLEEVNDAFVMFDKAEGRIIEGELTGQVSRAAAKSFYRESLIQLGWQLSDPTRQENEQVFFREGEMLIVRYSDAADRLTLWVSLHPVEGR